MLEFKSFQTADRTLKGIEAMHILRKGQAEILYSPVSIGAFMDRLFALSA
ncbi:hypothetical protein GCM10025859_08260 [Alicyclobacillus fastidiosus]|nr:hypothetical protein GCM10025859_08260 [Alicyclobacillus fastidiosus]